MSRCFISYRHVSPDQELAHSLCTALTTGGHSVFLDSKLEVGTRWVDEIERAIQATSTFCGLGAIHPQRHAPPEVALAHQLCVEKKLRILPVRVAYSATLPYDLAAYLNPFQYTSWKANRSSASVQKSRLP